MTQVNSFKSSLFVAAMMLTACGTDLKSEGRNSLELAAVGKGSLPVRLGQAGTLALLSKTGITDVYASVVTGAALLLS